MKNIKSNKSIGRMLAGGVLFAMLAGYGSQSLAADFPTRPINLIVPYAAGGSSDLSARPYAEELGNILKQPVVVMNKPGAGGAIGAAEVARAKGNGYTLLNASIGNITIAPYTSNVGYDHTALRAVAQMTDIPLALTVKADSSFKNLKEFVEYAKKNPGKIRYGSPGAGNIQHVTTEGWMKDIGIKLTHMPFAGANPAIAALLGGHVEATVTGVTEAAPHHKSGALRILGITSPARIDMVDAPTFKEQGYDLQAGVWYGVMAPASTPDDVVNALAAALKKTYDSPKVQSAWKKLFLIPSYLGPAEFGARVKKEAAVNEQVLKDIGLHKK
ncbi:tripartite tricarboxylate transporter substrate binding protein [Oleispirillum naphthae]|uniref:Bug family tripartite tricarboxylate transporter substrate binding protein n=1 Tax=Oleispirillum naphthae TaxID=2838853 RepID=UPI003082248A